MHGFSGGKEQEKGIGHYSGYAMVSHAYFTSLTQEIKTIPQKQPDLPGTHEVAEHHK